MEMSKGGHQLMKLETLGEWSQERSVLYIKGTSECINRKVHRVLNHKGVKYMDYVLEMLEDWSQG